MAVTAIRRPNELEPPQVLAPERYDPRREVPVQAGVVTVRLGDLVQCVRETISPGDNKYDNCFVLDTSHAAEGFVHLPSETKCSASIGSSKKVARAGDVIVSRLRPYLRQVAWIDDALANADAVLCSTEFFVLRSSDEHSISFLAPVLLTRTVHSVLIAAQEGGHHPRFNEATLLALRVPQSVLSEREKISRLVAESVADFRRANSKFSMAISASTGR